MTAPTTYRQQAEQAAEHLGAFAWILTDTWDDHDPWGSAIGVAFTLNDVLYVAGGATNPTYRPGLTVSGSSLVDEDYGGQALAEALEHGDLTVEAVECAERELDELLDVLKADGRDY